MSIIGILYSTTESTDVLAFIFVRRVAVGSGTASSSLFFDLISNPNGGDPSPPAGTGKKTTNFQLPPLLQFFGPELTLTG